MLSVTTAVAAVVTLTKDLLVSVASVRLYRLYLQQEHREEEYSSDTEEEELEKLRQQYWTMSVASFKMMLTSWLRGRLGHKWPN